MDTLGIFETPISKIDNFLSDSECHALMKYAKSTDYHAYSPDKLTTFGSKERNVLGKFFPWIQQRIEKVFTEYAYDTLKVVQTCDFKIMDSWATLTEPGGESIKHSHANCYWCGVLYIDDNCSPITFYRPKFNTSWSLDVTEFNEYSCNQISLQPERGLIIFFPHWLVHKVELNKTTINRHSVTFNILPNGLFGIHDSTCRINVLEI